MRAPRPALLLFLCVLVPASLSAQESPTLASAPVVSDPQAVALVQKALAALTGGLPVSDVKLSGGAHWVAGSDDEIGTANVTALTPAYSKLVLQLPAGPRVEIRNPSGTPLAGAIPSNAPPSAQGPQPIGARSGPDGVLHAISPNNTLTDATWFFPAFTLERLAASPNSILSYIGRDSINGLPALHISAQQQFPELANDHSGMALLQHLSQIEIYFDPTTFLPIALAFNTHPDEIATIDIPTLIEFSNYQTSSGVEIPLHVQESINNGLALDLHFNNVILNSGLTTAQFQIQ